MKESEDMKEQVGKVKRNSSLELLRIICMISIILYHYVLHGLNIKDINNIPMLNGMVTSIMLIAGRLSCNVFVLITGYFLIKQQLNIKKILNLIIKIFVYSIGIYIILQGFKLIRTDSETLKQQLLPIIYGNWFMKYYVIIYILSPFLNKMINSLDKVSHFRFIALLVIAWSIIPTFTEFTWSFSSVDAFLVMYIIGAYIRLYPKKKNNNKINILILLIGVVLLITISLLMAYRMPPFENVKDFFYKLNNCFMVMVAIYLFKVFENIRFINRPINYIASSVLGIYLIHDNKLMRPVIWNEISNNMDYINSKFYVFHVGIKVVLVFIICLIIDKVITKIMDYTIFKLINKLEFKKIKKAYIKIENKILNKV